MTAAAQECMKDTFKQISDTFARTMEIGTKFHEDNARFWTETIGRNLDAFRTQWQKLNDELLPFTRRNVERFHKLFDEQAQRSLELLRRSLEAASPAGDASQVYERVNDAWRSSFETLRESADAVAKANAEMFQGWTDAVRRLYNGAAAEADASKRRPAPKSA